MELVILDLLIAAIFIGGAVFFFYKAYQMNKAKKEEKDNQNKSDKY